MILGPKLAPHRGNQPFNFEDFFDFGALLGPRVPQDLSKRPPRSPKTPPSLLGPIFHDFEVQLDGFWSKLTDFHLPTLWILQPINQPNSQLANQPTSQRNHTSRHPYIPRPGGGWAEGNWIRRPRRGARRVQDSLPNPPNHKDLIPDQTDRPLWSITS